MPQTMLTTTDNPYNPFTNYDDWYAFDEAQGYHTCSYLARVTRTSNNLTVEEEDYEIEQAMNEIIKLNVLGIYTKVTNE